MRSDNLMIAILVALETAHVLHRWWRRMKTHVETLLGVDLMKNQSFLKKGSMELNIQIIAVQIINVFVTLARMGR